jgi:hypothetical protein
MLKTAIELLFDDVMESQLMSLLGEIRSAGLPSPLLDWKMRPHVSLMLGTDVAADLEHAVEKFAARTSPIPILLDSICAFPGGKGVVYLGPVVSRALLSLHAEANTAMASAFGELDPLYAPHRWMAHCTVAVGLDEAQVHGVMDICARAPLPYTGQVTGIGIHDVTIDPELEGWDRLIANSYRSVYPLQSG